MFSRWFDGQVLAEFSNTETSSPFPVQVIFSSNGMMSVTVGDESFTPSADDLANVAVWAQSVAKAMQIPDEQAYVGSYRCQVRPK